MNRSDDRLICGLCAHQRDDADLYAFRVEARNLASGEMTTRTIVICKMCSEDSEIFMPPKYREEKP
jgi:hypothetical protein